MGKQTIEELEAQVKQLAAENAALKELIEQHANCVAVCPNCCHEEPSETDDIVALYRAMETPATDAYAASLRAEGVEMAVEELIALAERSKAESPLAAEHAHTSALFVKLIAAQLRSKSEVQS